MQSHEKNRCILFARGTNDHATNSLDHQIERLRDFATRRNFKVVDEVRVDSVSGASWKKQEVYALVDRKREVDDFDLLLTADLTRFGRDGIEHLMMILQQLAKADITVLTLDNGLIDGSLLGLMKFAVVPTFQERMRKRPVRKQNPDGLAKRSSRRRCGACEHAQLDQHGPSFSAGEKVVTVAHAKEKEGRGSSDEETHVGRRDQGV